MTVSFLITEIRAKDPIREAIADQVLWFEKQQAAQNAEMAAMCADDEEV